MARRMEAHSQTAVPHLGPPVAVRLSDQAGARLSDRLAAVHLARAAAVRGAPPRRVQLAPVRTRVADLRPVRGPFHRTRRLAAGGLSVFRPGARNSRS